MNPPGTCHQRAQALAGHFAVIQATRMSGVPLLNPRLQVQAVGFQPWHGEAAAEPLALGVLVTPWFMNLVWLPLRESGPCTGGERAVTGLRFTTAAVYEPGLGGFEVCSLFSPMFDFDGQDAAVATAREVLAVLRPGGPARALAAPPASAAAAPVPSRRRFLLGRVGAAA